jgi:hypothetical protein
MHVMLPGINCDGFNCATKVGCDVCLIACAAQRCSCPPW